MRKFAILLTVAAVLAVGGCSSSTRIAALTPGDWFSSMPFAGGPPDGQWEPDENGEPEQ